MPAETLADPHLKKKFSFRDRLRWPSRSTLVATDTTAPVHEPPRPATAPAKKRSGYKPKHAATDFSRLAMPPPVPQWVSSQPVGEKGDSLTSPIPVHAAENRGDNAKATPTPTPTPTAVVATATATTAIAAAAAAEEVVENRPSTPTDNEAAPPTDSPSRLRKRNRASTAITPATKPPNQQPGHRPSTSNIHHHPHHPQPYFQAGRPPWDPSQAAVHVPNNNPPLVWLTPFVWLPVAVAPAGCPAHPQPNDRAPLVAANGHPEQHEPPPPRPADSGPMTDYELFIARAEAKDRADRERVWRTINQRSAAAAAAATAAAVAAGTAVPFMRPSPHMQFAYNATPTGLSGSTAVTDHTSAWPGGGRHSCARVNSSEDHGPSHQCRTHVRHVRHGSWPGKFGNVEPAGGDAIKVQENPEAIAGDDIKTSVVVANVSEITAGSEEPASAALRKRSSITSRIVEYIRPARESVDDPQQAGATRLYHSSSRNGMGNSGAGYSPIERVDE